MEEIKYVKCSKCQCEVVNLYRDGLCYDCWWDRHYKIAQMEAQELKNKSKKPSILEEMGYRDYSEPTK